MCSWRKSESLPSGTHILTTSSAAYFWGERFIQLAASRFLVRETATARLVSKISVFHILCIGVSTWWWVWSGKTWVPFGLDIWKEQIVVLSTCHEAKFHLKRDRVLNLGAVSAFCGNNGARRESPVRVRVPNIIQAGDHCRSLYCGGILGSILIAGKIVTFQKKLFQMV